MSEEDDCVCGFLDAAYRPDIDCVVHGAGTDWWERQVAVARARQTAIRMMSAFERRYGS